MEWFSIDMPADSLVNGVYHRLCRAFQRAFIDAGAPTDLALFAMRPGDAFRRLYLSPSSSRYVPDLIRRHDGHRCAAPNPAAVTLVYGVPGSVALLENADEQEAANTTIYPMVGNRRAVSTR